MDKLAEKYGFKIEKSGFKYSKGTRHVWLVFLGWQTADLKGQCLANYKKFKTLENNYQYLEKSKLKNKTPQIKETLAKILIENKKNILLAKELVTIKKNVKTISLDKIKRLNNFDLVKIIQTFKKLGFILGPLLFVLTLLFVHPEGLSKEANAVLATTLWVAVWWILEVVPIAVTSLLPIILFPITGALKIGETTASYGHKYVFLYIGGFILAIAIEKWNLHKRIALTIINIIGTSISRIILGFMVATAFLSMWISNTATTVMMLPIGMAIISKLKDNPNTVEDENTTFGKALLLAIS
ncbi:MAG: anion permease, partial [Candidatus Marinimicrobia bacterium]|nr:anion permease [Candidatus Neomarinimicrobiota bacterium]